MHNLPAVCAWGGKGPTVSWYIIATVSGKIGPIKVTDEDECNSVSVKIILYGCTASQNDSIWGFICVLIETSATTFIPQLYAVFFSLFTGNNLKSLKRRFLLRKRKLKPGGQQLTMAAFQDINNGMV